MAVVMIKRMTTNSDHCRGEPVYQRERNRTGERRKEKGGKSQVYHKDRRHPSPVDRKDQSRGRCCNSCSLQGRATMDASLSWYDFSFHDSRGPPAVLKRAMLLSEGAVDVTIHCSEVPAAPPPLRTMPSRRITETTATALFTSLRKQPPQKTMAL